MKNKETKKYFWKQIWNNRKIYLKKKHSNLEKLMILNGHADSINNIEINNWKKYGNNILLKLGIKKNESVFEYGCGSGALLYLFRSKTKNLFGCDYSKQLITASKKITSKFKIFNCDAEKFKSDKSYDYVIASSIFEYVEFSKIKKIIKNMSISFNKSIFIGEILDKKYEMSFLKKFNKPKKYYTFIDKKFFKKFCKLNCLKLKFYSSILPGSKQKKYRYCVKIWR